MSMSTSLLAYSDCIQYLDRALEDNRGIRIRVKDIPSAMYFRLRCNQARKLDRENNAKVYDLDHPMHGRSSYDQLVLKVRKADDNTAWVYIDKVRQVYGEAEALSELPPEELPEYTQPEVEVREIRQIESPEAFKRRV